MMIFFGSVAITFFLFFWIQNQMLLLSVTGYEKVLYGNSLAVKAVMLTIKEVLPLAVLAQFLCLFGIFKNQLGSRLKFSLLKGAVIVYSMNQESISIR